MAVVGTLVDGKYEILREIGRGGMSVVYLAMDTRLNKQWAIKEIARKANDANNDIVVSSLLAEANLMKKLDHPALPRIVDIIEESNTIYVVMDYIEGEPLSKILELYGAQDQDTVIEWGKQICDVLFYLHNCEPPIIYRDMKPANIMLKPDGTVKLIDFGIAREYKRSKTADTESLGTRGYAAPEQFGGKGQTDARTDIYSFGVTLYHLVTGKNPCEPPYELYPIKQINPNFHDGLQYLIQKCIQMNPEDRFQSCDEIRYVLDNIKEFDKGRRLNQNKKYKAFMSMVICAIVFIVLGSAGLGMRSGSIRKNYNENISILEDSKSNAGELEDSMNNIIKNIGSFSTVNILEAYADYYEAIYMLSLDDSSVLSNVKYSVKPETNIQSSDDGSDRYSSLSDDEKSYLAKACFYQGCIYFGQVSNDSSGALGSAKDRFSCICLDNKLGIANKDVSYNKEIFSELDVAKAKALYAISDCYSQFFETSVNNKTNIGIADMEDSSTNKSDTIDSLIESSSVLEIEGCGDGLKSSIYYAYARYLNDTSIIKGLKNEGVSADTINELYKIIYGEDWTTVYNQAMTAYGADISKTEAENLDVPKSVTGGINALAVNNPAVVDAKKWRFSIANSINGVYVANADS